MELMKWVGGRGGGMVEMEVVMDIKVAPPLRKQRPSNRFVYSEELF